MDLLNGWWAKIESEEEFEKMKASNNKYEFFRGWKGPGLYHIQEIYYEDYPRQEYNIGLYLTLDIDWDKQIEELKEQIEQAQNKRYLAM